MPRQKTAAAEKPEFGAQLFGRLRGYGGLRWACVRLCDGIELRGVVAGANGSSIEMVLAHASTN